MGFLSRLLVFVVIVAGIGGLVVLSVWDMPKPAETVEKPVALPAAAPAAAPVTTGGATLDFTASPADGAQSESTAQ